MNDQLCFQNRVVLSALIINQYNSVYNWPEGNKTVYFWLDILGQNQLEQRSYNIINHIINHCVVLFCDRTGMLIPATHVEPPQNNKLVLTYIYYIKTVETPTNILCNSLNFVYSYSMLSLLAGCLGSGVASLTI